MKHTWYDPCQICYDHNQLLFLLNHLHELEAGCYPGIDNDLRIPGGGIGQVTKNCPQSTLLYKPNPDALRFANELNTRLKLCKRDGQIVKARFADHKSVLECCKRFGLHKSEIYFCTHECLKYMEGIKRRRIAYLDWRRHPQRDSDFAFSTQS